MHRTGWAQQGVIVLQVVNDTVPLRFVLSGNYSLTAFVVTNIAPNSATIVAENATKAGVET